MVQWSKFIIFDPPHKISIYLSRPISPDVWEKARLWNAAIPNLLFLDKNRWVYLKAVFINGPLCVCSWAAERVKTHLRPLFVDKHKNSIIVLFHGATTRKIWHFFIGLIITIKVKNARVCNGKIYYLVIRKHMCFSLALFCCCSASSNIVILEMDCFIWRPHIVTPNLVSIFHTCYTYMLNCSFIHYARHWMCCFCDKVIVVLSFKTYDTAT